LDLLIEYAHAIESDQPKSAQERIVDAVQDFDLHYNKQMKLIAGNTHSSVDGEDYYPSLPLPSDELIADGPHGSLWLRTNACAPNQTNTPESPCLFTSPWAAKTYPDHTKGLPLAGPFVDTFSIDGVSNWRLPSEADWADLLANGTEYEATHADRDPGGDSMTAGRRRPSLAGLSDDPTINYGYQWEFGTA
jgi:hypothetical protein